MMNLRSQIQTGWPNQITLHQTISAYVRYDRVTGFKIGITNNPQARAANYGGAYDEMIVLYQTNSDKNVREMEYILTQYYRDVSDNINDGGGGPKGAGPYYLYIVLRR